MTDFMKPSTITGLSTSHPLYSSVERFYELGQLDKELVSDTPITTTATYLSDPDIGDCRVFDNSSDILTPSLSFDGGGKTVLIVHKTNAVFGDGGSDIDFLNVEASGHIVFVKLRNGIQYETVFRGAYGSQVNLLGGSLADQAALDSLRCFAVTLDEAAGIKIAADGVIDNVTSSTTNAFSAAQNVALMSNIGTGITDTKVGAIVLFNRVLTDGELEFITTYPYTLVGAPMPRIISDVGGNNIVQLGQTGITTDATGLDTNPVTQIIRVGGASGVDVTNINWNSGSPIFDLPLHSNIQWNSVQDIYFEDDTGSLLRSGVTVAAPIGWGLVSYSGIEPGAGVESFYKYITDAGITFNAGDIVAFETQAGLTVDDQTIFYVDPPATISGGYKVWIVSEGVWSGLSTYTIEQGALPSINITSISDTTPDVGSQIVVDFTDELAPVNAGDFTVASQIAGQATIDIPNPTTFILSGQTYPTLPFNTDISIPISDGTNTDNAVVQIQPETGYAFTQITAIHADGYYANVPGLQVGMWAYWRVTSGDVVFDATDGRGSAGSAGGTVSIRFYNGEWGTDDTITYDAFTVPDTQIPVITLLGNATVNHEQGTTYTDAGATATDNTDGDITNNIVVTNPVDENTLGSYTVRYNVSDAAGNNATEVTRTVNVVASVVVDTTLPVISLVSSNVTINQGSTFTEPGYSASDDTDGNITANVVIGGDTVDTNTIGTYVITYDVQDAAGNNAVQVTRTVTVIADEAVDPSSTPNHNVLVQNASTRQLQHDGINIPNAPVIDPNDRVNYGYNWEEFINVLEDPITSSTWTCEGLGMLGEAINGSITSVFVQNAEVGKRYKLSNMITTDSGKRLSRSTHILCLPL